MSRIIIGIHGLGNKPPKKIIEKWWLRSIKEGLYKIGKPVANIHFEMVYWSDILYDKPLDYRIKDHDHELFLSEKYRASPRHFKHKDHPIRQKILDGLKSQLKKILLNDDLTINYGFINDTIISTYFKDLDAYYSTESVQRGKDTVQELIRQRAVDVISKYKNDEIMLIGHSMGSIIAYDVLNFLLPDIGIDSLITIGSPLGLPIIQSKIAAERRLNGSVDQLRLKTPQGITNHWYNFSDLEDKVALIYDLSDDFEKNENGISVENLIVDNDYVNKGSENPHKSFGYLRTPELSEAVYHFLGKPSIPLLERIKMRLKKLVR